MRCKHSFNNTTHFFVCILRLKYKPKSFKKEPNLICSSSDSSEKEEEKSR